MYVLCKYCLLLSIVMCLCIRNEQHNYNENKGIFVDFLGKYLDTLATGCSGSLLKNHCRLMRKRLRHMHNKYAKKLGKLYKRLSKMYPVEINGQAAFYRQELDKKPYHRTEFLKAMNEIFNLQQHVQFEDYLHTLGMYCNGYKIEMDIIISKLLNDVILGRIKTRLSKNDQKKLRKKLKRAIEEYEDLEIQNLVLQYNLSTLKPFIPVRTDIQP